MEEKIINENQLEEKSLKEYKEQKGFIKWIKSRFEKLMMDMAGNKNIALIKYTRC